MVTGTPQGRAASTPRDPPPPNGEALLCCLPPPPRGTKCVTGHRIGNGLIRLEWGHAGKAYQCGGQKEAGWGGAPWAGGAALAHS